MPDDTGNGVPPPPFDQQRWMRSEEKFWSRIENRNTSGGSWVLWVIVGIALLLVSLVSRSAGLIPFQ